MSPRPHLTWQNGSAKMRTQQRRGLDHPPPATISSPLYQRILQFEALSSCHQQGNDVRRFAVEFSGGGWGGWTTSHLGNLLRLWHVPQLRWLVCLRWWATRLQLLQWRQMALQCPYWWPSKLQRTLGSRGGYVSWRIPPWGLYGQPACLQ